MDTFINICGSQSRSVSFMQSDGQVYKYHDEGEMKSMNNNYRAATVGYKYIAMRILMSEPNQVK